MTQPEALRLADALANLEASGQCSDAAYLTEWSEKQAEAAAAELRRQHSEIDSLRAEVARLRDAREGEAVAPITAKPLQWDQDSGHQWTSDYGGFAIMEEPGDELPFAASWGEDDAEQFATLAEAQAWCQAQIDAWVARYSVCAAPPAPAAPAEAAMAPHLFVEMAARAEIEIERLAKLPLALLHLACRIRGGDTLIHDDDLVDYAAHAIKAAALDYERAHGIKEPTQAAAQEGGA